MYIVEWDRKMFHEIYFVFATVSMESIHIFVSRVIMKGLLFEV